MAETTYTYSITSDMPGGAVNPAKLSTEIQASAIVTALNRVDTAGDSLKIVFNATLSAGDKTILDNDTTGPAGGLLAAHDSSTDPPDMVVQQEFRQHQQGMIIDGLDFQATQNQWKKVDYSLPKPLHIQEAWIAWKDCLLGDRGQLMVVHPSSEVSLNASAAQDDTTVDVGASNAPYFNPSGGAKYIEFWNSGETELLEVHKITSVSGANVTFETGLAAARDTSTKVKAVYGYYTAIRGTNMVEGGLRLLGTDSYHVDNPYSLSACLPTGMKISVRMKTADTAGTRELAVNFLFREPVA